jgi:hypothetical protein
MPASREEPLGVRASHAACRIRRWCSASVLPRAYTEVELSAIRRESYHAIFLKESPANPNSNEVVSRRFGFRQIEIRGSQFLINGVGVKMRGANHYET